ncbi:5962_t:CDS:2 [Entrophospora sp. SA101]|nr:5962_t:CDS:2 [Entrophospora sp. SA101]
MRIPPLMERLRRYYGCGVWAGKIFCVLVAIDFLLWRFLEWIFPESDIDIAPSFPYQKYRKMCQMADKDDDDLRDSLNRQQKTASFRLNKNKFVVVSMQRLTFFEWANLIISDDKKENIRSSDEVLGLLDNCDPPAMVHISQSRRGSSTSTIMSHSTSQTKINDQFSTDVNHKKPFI